MSIKMVNKGVAGVRTSKTDKHIVFIALIVIIINGGIENFSSLPQIGKRQTT
jgi:hypothetical protein